MSALGSLLQGLGPNLSARVVLRDCDRVGQGAQVRGMPRIVNGGRIELGERLRFSSQPVMSHLLAEHGGLISIGDDVSIGHGTGIAARGSVSIGNGTRIGAFVLVMDTDYHVAGDTTAHAEISPIRIGARARIGNSVTVLRGSVIGDDAVVLDGSVVAGIIPAGALVGGVPARALGGGVRADSGESIEQRVRRVARDCFRLAELPALKAGPAELEAWDSLGALSFLLALEEEFGFPLAEDPMRGVRSLLDASVVISTALDRR
jgi:acetyltransferase-like isoleucine patch superfamily enzyme/acyl carrier protein